MGSPRIPRNNTSCEQPENRQQASTTTYEEFVDPWEEQQKSGYAIPEVDTNYFKFRLLPPLRDGIKVEDVVSSLRGEGLFGWQRIRRHHRAGNSMKRGRKSDILAPLVNIFEKVTSLASSSLPHLEQTVEMASLSKRRRRSGRTVRSGSGYFFLKGAGERSRKKGAETSRSCSWLDVALSAEFDKVDTDQARRNNACSIVSNIQQAMARDPCRRFTFGITAESTNMRLWFCPHGTPVVSRSFDFTKEPKLLIHVFLSLAFASREELGWDPTIRLLANSDGERTYQVDVGDQTYETKKVLADNAADVLVSRATRVWAVSKPDSQESFVLKDVWVEDDRDLEHVIYEMLLRDVEDRYGTDVRKEVASHLLTPVAHWLVPLNGKEDHTVKVMMRGCPPSFKHCLRINADMQESADDYELDVSSNNIELQASERIDLRVPLPRCNPARKISCRMHYRIVFREVAEALHTVKNLSDVFTVLSDSAKVLRWIHGSGWVHRDISVGNLYLHDGRGVVGDLEYAKRKNSDVTPELRTGTPDFMAVEAALRKYIHLPLKDKKQVEAEISAYLRDSVEDIPTSSTVERAFFHNDLHDLESLWWISVWVLFSNHVGSNPQEATADIVKTDTAREHACAEIFPRSEGRGDRWMFLTGEATFARSLAWVSGGVRKLAAMLNVLRVFLVNKYEEFEGGYPEMRADAFEGTQRVFQMVFRKCSQLANGADLTLYTTIKRRLGQPEVESRREIPHPVVHPANQSAKFETSGVVSSNSPLKQVTGPTVNSTPGTESWSRIGKRKRDGDDETLVPMRRLQMPRYELRVC